MGITQAFVVDHEPINMNDFIAGRTKRGQKKSNSLKKTWMEFIKLGTHQAELQPVRNYPMKVHFILYAKNKMVDPDNLFSGTMKATLDALQSDHGGNTLTGDGWRETAGLSVEFHIDKKNPRFLVIITEADK